MELLYEKYLKSKKPYKCAFCGGEIPPNELYTMLNLSDNGKMIRARIHGHCSFLAFHYDMCDTDTWEDFLTEKEFKELLDEAIKEEDVYCDDLSYPERSVYLEGYVNS